MKIKIIKHLPCDRAIRRPRIGSVHTVIREEWDNRVPQYFVKHKNIEVGVFPRECEIVKEEV